MLKIRILETVDNTPGRLKTYNADEMKVTEFTILTEEAYNKLITEYLGKFVNDNDTSLFTVHLYNQKGLVKTYSYEDFHYDEYTDARVMTYEDALNEMNVLIEKSAVDEMRKMGMNV